MALLEHGEVTALHRPRGAAQPKKVLSFLERGPERRVLLEAPVCAKTENDRSQGTQSQGGQGAEIVLWYPRMCALPVPEHSRKQLYPNLYPKFWKTW